MPLDVQPLTLRRQFVRLAVLFALLIASLGLAQYLTLSRRVIPTVVVDLDPLGFKDAVLQDEPLDGELAARSGKVDGKDREVHILYSENVALSKPGEQLQSLFQELYGVLPQKHGLIRAGDHNWLEVSGPTSASEFAILRLLPVADHPLVICYSGTGQNTDADTAALNAICTTGLRINASAATRKK